jgi:hypothetical protein
MQVIDGQQRRKVRRQIMQKRENMQRLEQNIERVEVPAAMVALVAAKQKYDTAAAKVKERDHMRRLQDSIDKVESASTALASCERDHDVTTSADVDTRSSVSHNREGSIRRIEEACAGLASSHRKHLAESERERSQSHLYFESPGMEFTTKQTYGDSDTHQTQYMADNIHRLLTSKYNSLEISASKNQNMCAR